MGKNPLLPYVFPFFPAEISVLAGLSPYVFPLRTVGAGCFAGKEMPMGDTSIKKERANLVKYSNRLNLNPLGSLSSNEQDVFINIMAIFHGQNARRVEIRLADLKDMAGMSGEKYSYFLQKLTGINEHLISNLVYTIETEKGLYTAPLFQSFLVTKDGRLIAELNELMASALFDIEGSFTRYKRLTFMKFRSKYTKSLFRLFAKNHKGHFQIGLTEFKEAMALPPKYSQSNLRKVIHASVAELEEKYYGKGTVTVTDHYGRTRGQPLESLEFTYPLMGREPDMRCDICPDGDGFPVKMVAREVAQEEQYLRADGLPGLRRVTALRTEALRCPLCGAPVGEFLAEDGRRYEICKNNRLQRQFGGSGACTYFRWIPESEIVPPFPDEKK